MPDITLQNFESDLIAESSRQPVLLDVWAPWCGPCKTLGPVLEKLEAEYAGRFRLAKLNADEQPEIAGQLSQMFGVRSIPLCVLFKDGQPVDGFVGALPAAQVRAFLDKHLPTAEEEAALDEVEEAHALLAEGDTDSALAKLLDAVAVDPADAAARYDALRALLVAGRVDEARALHAPVAHEVLPDPRFVAVGHWIAALDALPRARPEAELAAAIAADRRDFDARFELAQRHMAEQRFTDALDDLLEIVMRDKTWRDELARKTFVAILELMKKPPAPKADAAAAPAKGQLELARQAVVAPTDPVVDGYRRKLSMALF